MSSSLSERGAVRIVSPGHAIFAATMIGIGLWGLIRGGFTVIWQGVPKGVPGRTALADLCSSISLATGVGLLFRSTAAVAARVLLASFGLWFLLWRVRALFIASLIEGTWSCGETMVMAGAAWVLFATFATDWDRRHLAFATGEKGLHIARVLYGIGLIPFGYAHFANVPGTAPLVPAWLPWHVFWAYFTGATFIAAGVAIVAGVWARLAAVLSVWQMGLFGLLVWVPIVTSGQANAFQWVEFATNIALVAAGWVVADSYRGTPWLAAGKPRRVAASRSPVALA